MRGSDELVGIIPAAGRATRLGRLPCSKEVLPIGWEVDMEGRPRALVACEPLLRQMRIAGARRAFVVVGSGKWDIPAFLGNGEGVGLDLAYLVIADSPSTVHTVARACRHVGEATVLFGFPDLVLRPDDPFAPIVDRHRDGGADVVLGLCPVDEPSLFDMVEMDGETVRRIEVKPVATSLHLTWIVAVWSATFTAFVEDWLGTRGGEAPSGRELYMSDALLAASTAGLAVVGQEVRGGGYDDFGLPRSAISRGS